MDDRKKKTGLILLLGVLLVIAAAVSLMIGRYPVSLGDFFSALLGQDRAGVLPIITGIRLPRVLASVCVGGCLSAAGASYQSVFRNPMAAPDILGASTGAGFGAALAIVLGMSSVAVTGFAFLFSLLSVAVVFLISGRTRGNRIMALVLAGIMIGSLFNAGTSFLKLIADQDSQLPAITFWMMGSLSGVDMRSLLGALVPMALGLIPLVLLSWRISILTMGDDEARTMGINTDRLRAVTVICATLITAAAVSVSGMIGFVGLIVPHLMRRPAGNNLRYLLPVSVLAGGLFLTIVDNICRCAFTAELPIGILTAFVGVPFFLWLMLGKERVL